MQRQAQVPGSFLRQEILKCAEALKEGKDKTEVAAKLASLSADSYAEQASVDTASCRLTAVPFDDMLVIRAFSPDGTPVNSIDVSYNINMGCFVAKPSVTGKGM